ncbi:hypothetical protein LTR95_015397, partial [Oleoguttula sp. CCFEE 5521]
MYSSYSANFLITLATLSIASIARAQVSADTTVVSVESVVRSKIAELNNFPSTAVTSVQSVINTELAKISQVAECNEHDAVGRCVFKSLPACSTPGCTPTPFFTTSWSNYSTALAASPPSTFTISGTGSGTTTTALETPTPTEPKAIPPNPSAVTSVFGSGGMTMGISTLPNDSKLTTTIAGTMPSETSVVTSFGSSPTSPSASESTVFPIVTN